jgi:hypothetical protein
MSPTIISLLTLVSASFGNPASAAQVYDQKVWELIKSTTVSVDAAVPSMRVMLLRSKAATGESGTSDPLYSVNLLITAQDDTILYQFAPSPPKPTKEPARTFFMDDRIEVRDVTNDNIPEVQFDSGCKGASKDAVSRHVIKYDAGRKAWGEVKTFGLGFGSGGGSDIDWLDVDGAVLGIAARPVRFVEDDPFSCNVCPHYYEYRIYRWATEPSKPGNGCFTLLGTINGEQATEEPIRAEMGLLLGTIRKLHINGREPEPCP